jgi:hypothetical protein
MRWREKVLRVGQRGICGLVARSVVVEARKADLFAAERPVIGTV